MALFSFVFHSVFSGTLTYHNLVISEIILPVIDNQLHLLWVFYSYDIIALDF